jgi:hypothetical protein
LVRSNRARFNFAEASLAHLHNEKAPAEWRGLFNLIEIARLVFGWLENLAAAIHTGLKIDMVRAAKLTRILVFDESVTFQTVMRTAHAAA